MIYFLSLSYLIISYIFCYFFIESTIAGNIGGAIFVVLLFVIYFAILNLIWRWLFRTIKNLLQKISWLKENKALNVLNILKKFPIVINFYVFMFLINLFEKITVVFNILEYWAMLYLPLIGLQLAFFKGGKEILPDDNIRTICFFLTLFVLDLTIDLTIKYYYKRKNKRIHN